MPYPNGESGNPKDNVKTNEGEVIQQMKDAESGRRKKISLTIKTKIMRIETFKPYFVRLEQLKACLSERNIG